jgi:hypothetical protein
VSGLFGSKDSRDTEAASRVRKIALEYKKYKLDHMPVDQVLDLLNPDGDWTRQAITLEVRDPGTDPLTGCLPVTAQSPPRTY